MSSLPDEAHRARFREEGEGNFSVIAPAGVGKTTAIVQRLANLATGDEHRAAPITGSLVLVTYTRKAAEEMRQRTLAELYRQQASPALLERVNSAFFGTIHAFCKELLQRFGTLVGLPTTFDIETDEAPLWREFLRQQDDLLEGLPATLQEGLRQQGSLVQMLGFVPRLPGCSRAPSLNSAYTPPPQVDLTQLMAYAPSRKGSQKTVQEGQRQAQFWWQQVSQRKPSQLPHYTKGGKEFLALWAEAFGPLNAWLDQALLDAGQQLAWRFHQFRISQRVLLYQDLVTLSAACLQHPEVRARLGAQALRVVLDEAQDTDPDQFRVLLGVAAPEHAATGLDAVEKLAPGRFCMVGDPQQSIYKDRADLAIYRSLHQRLCASGAGQELRFTVTMRCPQAVVSWANEAFPAVLGGQRNGAQQVDYVPLQPRPGALAGKVWRLPLEAPPDKLRVAEAAQYEASELAAWLGKTGLSGLGVQQWSEVAILAPRNEWIDSLAAELERAQLPFQRHSSRLPDSQNPAVAWFTALWWVLAHPHDQWEVVGVLREVFGLSDDALAWHRQVWAGSAQRRSLALLPPTQASGPVGEALRLLAELAQLGASVPPFELAQALLKRIELPARLRQLEPFYEVSLADTLQRQVQQVLAWECAGHDARQIAGLLRRQARGRPESEDVQPQALQLMSFHKAKGLEWPVVILPSLFREVPAFSENYPMVLKPSGAAQPLVANSAGHQHPRAKAQASAEDFFEKQRLLYVAATRAKRQLVLVGSEACFQRNAGSMADVMGWLPDGTARQVWEAVPEGAPPAEGAPAPARPTEGALRPVLALPEQRAESIAVARQVARRVLPSSLAPHEQPERDEPDLAAVPEWPEQAPETRPAGGADYGNWWHDTMQWAPWQQGTEALATYWQSALARAPLAERAAEELRRWQESTLLKQLLEASQIITEVPFFWRQGDAVYDGYIDLLAFLPQGKLLVVDWKTDRLAADELPRRYGPQIQVYAWAAEALTQCRAQPVLYSTMHSIALPVSFRSLQTTFDS